MHASESTSTSCRGHLSARAVPRLRYMRCGVFVCSCPPRSPLGIASLWPDTDCPPSPCRAVWLSRLVAPFHVKLPAAGGTVHAFDLSSVRRLVSGRLDTLIGRIRGLVCGSHGCRGRTGPLQSEWAGAGSSQREVNAGPSCTSRSYSRFHARRRLTRGCFT